MTIGAARSGLALAPPHGAAVHHASRSGAGLVVLLTAGEWVTVIRHHPRKGSRSHNVVVTPQRPGSVGCFAFFQPATPVAYPRHRRNHQAPSRRPPRQPFWWWVSQDSRFCGERMGVMCPKEWMDTRSDATASGEGRKGCEKPGRGPPLWRQLLPLDTAASGHTCPWTHLPLDTAAPWTQLPLDTPAPGHTCCGESPGTRTVALVQRLMDQVGPLLGSLKGSG